MTKKILTLTAAALGIGALSATAGLNTVTLIGGGIGSADGDLTGVGPVTLLDDTAAGDMWNGGDTFTYLHDSAQQTGSFTATVRVVGQTQDAGGRWGKGGIIARPDLDPLSVNAQAQVSAGIGSQLLPPSRGDHSPVPIRLAGRADNVVAGDGGFETAIVDVGTGVDSVNNVFPEGEATNATWLSLSYNAGANEFVAGFAPDDGGAPGAWSFSPGTTALTGDGDGWYVGIGYSAHNGMDLDAAGTQGQHGITFDNYSLVPEPSTSVLGLLGLGALVLRRRR